MHKKQVNIRRKVKMTIYKPVIEKAHFKSKRQKQALTVTLICIEEKTALEL